MLASSEITGGDFFYDKAMGVDIMSKYLQCSLFYTVLMQGVLAEATEGVEILGPAQ